MTLKSKVRSTARKVSGKVKDTAEAIPGPSPNPATNLLIMDIAMRGASMIAGRAIQRALLGARYDADTAADIVKGRHVDKDTRMLVVPGSVRVRLQAEDEGLDVIFKEAGAEWRGAGCSMCLGMNPDTLQPGERSASTSNRNFEGRQGKGGRTHLVSVPVAAATAIRGTLSSPADLEEL